jgi:hypothetical protein
MTSMAVVKRVPLFFLVAVVPVFFAWLFAPVPDTGHFDAAGTVAVATLSCSLESPLFDQDYGERIDNALAFLRLPENWGGSTAGPENGQRRQWKLAGLVSADAVTYALIEEGSVVTRYTAGDTLPLGEQLVKVGEGFINLVLANGTLQTISLYPKGKE